MTIITKKGNEGMSIVLDNITEITKGETIYTSCNSYHGWHLINFRDLNGKLIQWDYGKSDEAKKLRDEEYERIIGIK